MVALTKIFTALINIKQNKPFPRKATMPPAKKPGWIAWWCLCAPWSSSGICCRSGHFSNARMFLQRISCLVQEKVSCEVGHCCFGPIEIPPQILYPVGSKPWKNTFLRNKRRRTLLPTPNCFLEESTSSEEGWGPVFNIMSPAKPLQRQDIKNEIRRPCGRLCAAILEYWPSTSAPSLASRPPGKYVK